MHIKKGDLVEVIAGDDAVPGRARKVLTILRKEGKVVVEGVNRTKKHVKPNRRNPQGGQLSKELPIDASNVLLYCSTCRRGPTPGWRRPGAAAASGWGGPTSSRPRSRRRRARPPSW